MFPEDRMLEFVIIGAIALIVIKPKDLPTALRKFGQFVAKMRAMAAEFRASFDELARQSELDELRREVEALRSNKHEIDSAFSGAAADFNAALAPRAIGLGGPMIPLAAAPEPEPVVEPVSAPAPVVAESTAEEARDATVAAPPPAPKAVSKATASRPKAALKTSKATGQAS